MSANRIDDALRTKAPGLWPFLPAGYPDLQATGKMLRRLGDLPVRGVEVGFPFSDPIADGPVIQNAFTRALAAGVRVADVFEMVAGVRAAATFPLVAMVSASIVYRLRTREFVKRAAEAGFDGLIVPDLSLEEAPELAEIAGANGVRMCMLVAPTTTPERQRRIAELASGFLYYVCVQGVTGQRDALPNDLADHVKGLRASTGRPVLVGFGIGTSEQVRRVCDSADGAIVGSAIVQWITRGVDEGRARDEIVESAVNLVHELAAA